MKRYQLLAQHGPNPKKAKKNARLTTILDLVSALPLAEFNDLQDALLELVNIRCSEITSAFPVELWVLIFKSSLYSTSSAFDLWLCFAIMENCFRSTVTRKPPKRNEKILINSQKIKHLQPVETLSVYRLTQDNFDDALIRSLTNLKRLNVFRHCDPWILTPSCLEPLVLLENLFYPYTIPTDILSKFERLRSLGLVHWTGDRAYQNEDLSLLTNLTRLEMLGVSTLTDGWFSTLKNLISLYCVGANITNVSLNQFSNLTDLQISTELATEQSLSITALPCPDKLEALHVDSSSRSVAIDKDLIHFTNLKKLTGNIALTDQTIKKLTKLEDLEALSSSLSDDGISRLEKLRILHLRPHLISLSGLRTLTCLEKLTVLNGDWEREEIEDALPQLTFLELEVDED